jgi:hypothetical protein
MFDVASLQPYFQVQVTRIPLTQAEWVQVATANPTRVYLAFTRTATDHAYFNSPPNIKNSPYMMINAGNSTLELYWQRHGPLVQLEWYGLGELDPDPGITVIEVMWQPPPEG